MYRFAILLLAVVSGNLIFAQTSTDKKIEKSVDSLLRLMTLEEKIGQMNQYNGPWAATGPLTNDDNLLDQVKTGKVGSMLNVTGVKRTRELQELALQSRLKIPMLFGQDVIHGFRTIFPIPLGEAASWDLKAMEDGARVAATEASAAGVHWTFAPMVDIARDPRWGRVMEGAGEDTYLGSLIAKARVKGFQGTGFGDTSAVMACAKHFAAYGAAVGGRDYNSVDMSLRQLHETYLPPFKAAVEAGAATFMNSFNDINGIPATGNKYIQRDILKRDWKFTGFVVSDWGSIGEMINHGYSKDSKEAGMQAANAGSDMDMESRSYTKYLSALVKEGKVKMAVIDDAVRRILRKKFEMGLFTDPYKFSNEKREQTQWNNLQHRVVARDMAKKSIVLLKNEKQVLPISKQTGSIALIGPFVKAKSDHLGFWSYDWPDDSTRIVSLWEGVKAKVAPSTKMLYAKGCGITDLDKTGFAEAVETARKADYVILTIGETRDMSGEAKSRSSIQLPGVQEDLVKEIVALGKPTVVMISAGRPLVFNWTADHAPAILYTWWLGTEAGNAMADVLFGDYNPSGKLPMSFPRTEGQIPIYYNHYNTGRPAKNDSDRNYRSAYTDLSIYPKYAFGHGLSYSNFEYSDITLSALSFTASQRLTATVTLTNKSSRPGTETVQLYIRDITGSVVRPVKELKGFQQVLLNGGETKTISFTLTANDLRFYNDQLQYIYEPGEFKLFIGSSSDQVKEVGFELK
ncbi:MAG TPA: glycoside hydrolase family 3 N-terminal domain-containing protein [Chitinophagaceae bacterium]|nr:glycoside hydrolase family 3 N-terminal domain-containing protein [Chitinophagaceae bacterium]HPN57940.1 glycoside hydrolase family 3 N-terminal domain-containing protein [Chitinophagaceae bacterium]